MQVHKSYNVGSKKYEPGTNPYLEEQYTTPKPRNKAGSIPKNNVNFNSGFVSTNLGMSSNEPKQAHCLQIIQLLQNT